MSAWAAATRELPHLKDAIAYAYRHSFATDALTSGVGVAQVAELLGHRDATMVHRHYGHLADQIEHMKEAAGTYRIEHYMGDVARVHEEVLRKQNQPKDK